MVTLNRPEAKRHRESQMEMMMMVAGLMSMMAVSLVFQRASFKKIEVAVKK